MGKEFNPNGETHYRAAIEVRRMTTDTDMLEANIKNLERENRELRMTLRDQFAMAALTGLLADGSFSANYHAGQAYLVADTMLEARK